MNIISLLGLLLFFGTKGADAAQPAPIPSLTSPLGPVVNLGFAAFAGNDTSPSGQLRGPVTFFGSIPYAQPPLGDLRFRAPRPLDESFKNPGHVSIFDARNWGAPCIQQPAEVGVGSEDCLTLNIWKPSNATEGSSLPVVFYIHGGGFFAGTPQGFPLFDWVAQNQGIVGVSVTYRLNLLGFLAGSTVSSDGDLNTGLLDQRAALEWVQRNIHRFGGNPNEVTIVGESAGGASVAMQIVAFGGSRPALFKRAVAHSIGFGPTPTSAEAEATFRNVTSVVGCPASGRDAMACLRNASIGAIVSAIDHVPAGHLVPIVDGPLGILPDLPSQLISSGRLNNVDFIGGHCTNDGRTFVGGRPEQFNTDDDIVRLLFSRWPGVSKATMERAFEIYPSPNVSRSPFKTQYDRASQMAQEVVFSCMDWLLADKLTSRNVDNVFAFRWNSPHAVLFAENPFQGVMHTSDLYFLFDGTTGAPNAGSTFRAFNASEAALSKEAIAFWTSFTASGDPSAQRLPPRVDWTRFATLAANRSRIILTRGDGTITNTTMEVFPEDEISRCRFWMSSNVTEETRV